MMKDKRSKITCIFLLIFLLPMVFSLNGCQVLDWLNINIQPTDATQTTPTTPATLTPIVAPTATSTKNPFNAKTLIIWMPKQFDPENKTQDANILKERLEEFKSKNPDIEIQVRLKSLSGPGNLVDALAAAKEAAPGNMPSLVILPHSDLEVAVQKGLVYSLNNYTNIIDSPDWYEFARKLASIQGATYGLPFAGDALLLVYRPGDNVTPPGDWVSLMQKGKPVIFPAADPQGLLTMSLYRAAGGALEDRSKKPVLDKDALSKVLKFYSEGGRQGIFLPDLAQYQTDSQSWQVFNNLKAQWLVSWSSLFFKEKPEDLMIAPLPAFESNNLSLATGWVWALSDPYSERQALSASLAEWLTGSSFLAKWTEAGGYIPPRPTALAAWKDQAYRSVLNNVALSAVLKPDNEITAIISPALYDAALQVIRRQADPADAAQAAIDRVNAPPVK